MEQSLINIGRADDDKVPVESGMDVKAAPLKLKDDANTANEGNNESTLIKATKQNATVTMATGRASPAAAAGSAVAATNQKSNAKTVQTASRNQINANNNTKRRPSSSKSHCFWIYNITRGTKASALKSYLSKYAKIVSTKIVTDGSSCYGYATADSTEAVNRLLTELTDTYFEGKRIKLSVKKPDRQFTRFENVNFRRSLTSKVAKSSTLSRNSSISSISSTKSNHSPRRLTYRYTATLNARHTYSSDKRRWYPRDDRSDRQRRKRRSPYSRHHRSSHRTDATESDETLEAKVKRLRADVDEERQRYEQEKCELLKLRQRLANYERARVRRETDVLKKETRRLEKELLQCKNSEIQHRVDDIKRKYTFDARSFSSEPYDAKVKVRSPSTTPPPPPIIRKSSYDDRNKHHGNERSSKKDGSYHRYRRYHHNNGRNNNKNTDVIDKERLPYRNTFGKYRPPCQRNVAVKKPLVELQRNDGLIPTTITTSARNTNWKEVPSSVIAAPPPPPVAMTTSYHHNNNHRRHFDVGNFSGGGQPSYWKEEQSMQDPNQRYFRHTPNTTYPSTYYHQYPDPSKYGFARPDADRQY